jgi:transketolase
LCADTLRLLAVDMVEKANSGHPGLPMGAADMAYVLWTRHLRHNPSDPTWPDRDRFVLSAGHGSSLLYSLLHLSGYDLSLDDLKAFRSWGSRTPGHPECHMTPGVEVTTGPLGQGIANAVGLAIAERYLAARFNRDNFPLVDHTTYTLVGDGDLMEGISTEAISLAGHLRLGKLICLYDSNGISLAADTRLSFTEDVAAKFVACGWQVLTVADGHDASAIDAALVTAKAESERPTLIVVTTHIGFGSPNRQDSCDAHGSPLGADEVAKTKLNLGWTATAPFTIPAEALAVYRASVNSGSAKQATWEKLLADYGRAYPELKAEWDLFLSGQLPAGWDAALPVYLPG